MGNSLRQLFSLNKQASANQPQAPAVTPIQPQNDVKQEGETYSNYGKRICGLVNASNEALPPFLQRIYNYIKHEQLLDEASQKKLKEKTQKEIDDLDVKIKTETNNQALKESQIQTTEQKISDLKSELSRIKDVSNVENKEAKAKMILGLCVIIPLTIYLFLFYGSTFYSAFFKVLLSSEDASIMNSIFDPLAFSKALDTGVMEFAFILFAPIIFMGLGFCLHVFSVQKGKSKYLKMSAVVAVTFVFDCILAYLIGKKIQDFNALNGLGDVAAYTISSAKMDINFWAVIFCGFVVYIIWGLVFDMTINAYLDCKSNKSAIEACKNALTVADDKLSQLRQQLNEIKNAIVALEGKKEALIKSMNNAIIDLAPIKAAMSDFFTGWISLMPALGKSEADQNKAKQAYATTINSLLISTPTTTESHESKSE